MLYFQVVMTVPGLPRAVPELDEPHAPLHEPAGGQELPSLHARSIHIANVLRLTPHIECLGRLSLHPKTQLKRTDAGVEGAIVLMGAQMPGIDAREQIELLAL